MGDRKRNLLTGTIIGLFFAFTVLFYGPLSQYLSNSQELWFSLNDVFRVIVPFSLVTVALAAVFFVIVPPKAGSFLLKLFFGVSLGFYIQGNYLRNSYGTGVMDGTAVDWSEYTTYGLINLAIWAVCILLPFIVARFIHDDKDGKKDDDSGKAPRSKEAKIARLIIIASLFFTVIQLPALASQAVSYKPNENSDLEISTEGIYELSDKENVVMFILDTLDQNYYETFVADHPEFTEKLKGFTSYDNTVASGSRTTIGVPSMLTGIPYKKQTIYSDYIKDIYSKENPLSMLHDAGFDVRIYSETMLFSPEAADYVSNFSAGGGGVSSWKVFAKKIYKLDLCKFLPHFLKKYIWFDTAEFESARESSNNYKLDDAAFYKDFTSSKYTVNKDKPKVFRLYHLYGDHEPYNLSSKAKRVEKSSCKEQTEGTMLIVEKMLDDMKEKGLYDDSTIIITADHGDLEKAQYSMLLIKASGDTDDYRISHVPASAFDLTIYLAGLAGVELKDQTYGLPIDSLKEGMDRERHVFHNTTNDNKFIIDEYVTTGDARDLDKYEHVKQYKESEDENTPYELGTELSFTTDATGNKYCVEGLGTSTGFRCVLRGPHAKFSFPIKDIPKEGGVTVHFDLHYKTVSGMKMIVTANGEEVFNGKTDEDMIKNGLDITVPASAFSDSDKLVLEFAFPEIDESEMEIGARERTDTLSLLSMVITDSSAGKGASGKGGFMTLIYGLFNWILGACYNLLGNYGLAIILFTLISKIILLPISIWVQKNSIKMVKLMPELNMIKVKHFGDKDTIADETQKLYKREGYNAFASVIPTFVQLFILICLIGTIRQNVDSGQYDPMFLGIDLSLVPAEAKGLLVLAPILAGVSALLLSISQNKMNVLQAEQSKGMQYGTLAFSVGLSLWLGWFVPAGVAVYWISSNLMSIVQQWILNKMIDPRKHVDYEKLEASQKELKELGNIDSQKKRTPEQVKREKEDYKRFFSIDNKHLVFYSESSGFYKYFKGVIEYVLKHTKVIIHYITSDPDDIIFSLAEKEPRIKPYYIGEKKLITLMMKMDADIVVMTMPDLENYHIKRSYIRKDIEYIFIPHSMCSLNLTMRTASIVHFDTIFCTGKHQVEETQKTEIAYGLPKKNLVEWDYCLLDDMRSDYSSIKPAEEKTVLIAPSWQKDNIVDSCLEDMLDALRGKDYKIIVRPHPQHVRHQPEKMEMLKTKYANDSNIEIQTDFSSNDTVFQADMMITDWSGIAYEYSFTTYKPVIFIDTPMKIMNPEYTRIDTEPFNIWMRDILGTVIKPEDVSGIGDVVDSMYEHADEYRETIKKYAYDYVYNLDNSSEVGGKYIIAELHKYVDRRNNNK